MGFRFRRKLNIIPGVSINLSTTGASLSLGGRGASVNLGRRGVRSTVDLPGSGAYYSTQKSWGSLGGLLGGGSSAGTPQASAPRSPGRQPTAPAPRSPGRQPAAPRTAAPSSAGSPLSTRVGEAEIGENAAPLYIAPGARLELNFFQKLSAPDEEEALLAGLKSLAAGDQRSAYDQFVQAAHLADGAFMAGVCALQFGIFTDAENWLLQAAAQRTQLGATLRKYGVNAWVSFQLTEDITAHIQPDIFGTLLALAEAQQRLDQVDKARDTLRELLSLAPGDMLTRLSLAELLSDESSDDADVANELASLGAGIENDSELHCALLLYQGKALERLKLFDGAKAALTKALSKRKDRSVELLCAIRYERAGVLDSLGDKRGSQADYERIFADDPDYEDVAQKLGKV